MLNILNESTDARAGRTLASEALLNRKPNPETNEILVDWEEAELLVHMGARVDSSQMPQRRYLDLIGKKFVEEHEPGIVVATHNQLRNGK